MNKAFIKKLSISFIIWLALWSVLYIFIAPQKSMGSTIFSIVFMAACMSMFLPLSEKPISSLLKKIGGKNLDEKQRN